jgi:microcystin-dependent protein
MSSPITGKDWVIATLGQPFCERMTNLLSLASKMKVWFDWAFDSSGNATDDFKSMFLLPPGVILPYYSTGSEEAVKAAVMLLNGGDATNPFWRLCDGTGGTPDIRGRAVVGAGQGTSLSNRLFGSFFGSEEHEILSAQIPTVDHFHGTGKRMNGGIDSGNNDFAFIMKSWTLQGSYHYNELQGDGSLSGSGDFSDTGTVATTNMIKSGDVKPAEGKIPLVQPSVALWYIMRTNRTE